MKKQKLGLLQMFTEAELQFLSIGFDSEGKKILKKQLEHEKKGTLKKSKKKQ